MSKSLMFSLLFTLNYQQIQYLRSSTLHGLIYLISQAIQYAMIINIIVFDKSHFHKQSMQDTEKYLNSILQKRLGSVVNQNSVAKNANTVTRLPRKQQKLQSMPTVFRKKQQSVYPKSSQQNGLTSQYSSSQQQNRNNNTNPYRSSQYRTQIINEQQDWEENNSNISRPPKQSQRVQYMLISKRIDTVRASEKAPTVDISKYHKQEIEQQRERTKYLAGKNINQPFNYIEGNNQHQETIKIAQRFSNHVQYQELPKHIPIVNPRRKKIFGSKKQESSQHNQS